MPDTPPTPRPRARRSGPKPSDPTGKQSTTESTDTTDNSGTGGKRGGGPAAAANRPPRSGSLEAKLGELFGSFSLIFAASGDQYCAEIVALRSPALAQSWAELARQNASVKRVLESLVEGSAWGGVIFSTLGIAIPIAKHHGLYRGPDPFSLVLPGPPPPNPSPQPGRRGTGENGTAFHWSRNAHGEPTPRVIVPDPPSNHGSSDDGEPPAPIYLEGAPPGVVTVAASAAQHNGAR